MVRSCEAFAFTKRLAQVFLHNSKRLFLFNVPWSKAVQFAAMLLGEPGKTSSRLVELAADTIGRTLQHSLLQCALPLNSYVKET